LQPDLPAITRRRNLPGPTIEGKEAPMPDRELIDTGKDKRYVRRDDQGQFNESEDVGRSSAQDQKRDAQNDTRKGQGDRGDRKGA
jgi:hypothetical protein